MKVITIGLFLFCFLLESHAQVLQLGHEALIAGNKGNGLLKCEPSCVLTDKVIVVTWNDSYGGSMKHSTTGTAIAWAISYDTGKSFQFGGYLLSDEEKYNGADSWLGKDTKGNIYLSLISWQENNIYKVYLYRMDFDKPGKWELINIPVSTPPNSKVVIDKPSMYIAPDNSIFISYLRKTGMSYVMETTISADEGKTFSPPIAISDTSSKTRLGNTIVKQGRTVLCSWVEGGKNMRLNELWYSISFDNGLHFSKPAMLSANNSVSGFAPKGYNAGLGIGPFEMTEFPSMASSQKYMYIILNEPSEAGSTIKCYAYDLHKRHWKPGIKIGNTGDSSLKMMPVSIAGKNEKAYTVYYFRSSTKDSLTDVYLSSISGSNYKLTATPSNWSLTSGDAENAPVQRNFGDYIFGCMNKGLIYTVWTDGRNGVPQIFGRLIGVKN
jgi:hypothetical protein